MADLDFYLVRTETLYEFELAEDEVRGFRNGRPPSVRRVLERVESAAASIADQEARECEWAAFFARHEIEVAHAGAGFYVDATDTVVMVDGGGISEESATKLALTTHKQDVLVLWGRQPPLAYIVYPSPLRPGLLGRPAHVGKDPATFARCAHCREWQFTESEGIPCRACDFQGAPTFAESRRPR